MGWGLRFVGGSVCTIGNRSDTARDTHIDSTSTTRANDLQDMTVHHIKSLPLLLLLLLARHVHGFVISPVRSTPSRWQAADADIANDSDIADMRLGQIQQELRDCNVSYADCFDRESLTKRLLEARESKASATEEPIAAATGPADDDESFQQELDRLRSLRVRELREECAKRQIRWGSFVEKEDLVQAVFAKWKEGANFSVTGMIAPGEVVELNGEQLEQELASSDTPILLDVYATWCGPCQMMAPQLSLVAQEWNDAVRVIKVDSDKHPDVAQKYRVGGLPTLVVLEGGKEQQRVEGALMKDGLLQLMQPYIDAGGDSSD